MHSRKRGNEKAARRRLTRCALVPLPGPLGSQPLFGGGVQGSFPVPFRLLGSLDGEGAHQVQHWSLLSDSDVELSLTIIHGKINNINPDRRQKSSPPPGSGSTRSSAIPGSGHSRYRWYRTPAAPAPLPS